jgi:uncharacterized protein YaaR (DUF327 family)
MKRDTSSERWRESTIKACRNADEKLTTYRDSLVSRRDKNITILKKIETKNKK